MKANVKLWKDYVYGLKRIFFLFILFSIVFQFEQKIYAQDQPKPEFFGIFVVSKGNLLEFKDSDSRDLTAKGTLVSATLGLTNIAGTKFFSDPKMYFVIYGDRMNPMKGQKPILSSLLWDGNLGMWVAGQSINLRVGPVPGLPDAYKLIPENPLPQGRYCFHSGRLNSTSPMDGTIESNARKDVWPFWISKEYMGTGQLSSVSTKDGEYTCPPSYGFFLIQDLQYIQVPVSRDKVIEDWVDNGQKKQVLTELSGIVVDSSRMMPWMVSNCEKDLRPLLINASLRISYSPYKDFIPEKMVFSKLEKKTVDLRSEKEIKKGEPAKMTEVWVADKQVPFLAYICDIDHTITRIVPVAELNINAPKINLSPGVYALHNGILTNGKTNFGTTNIVYTFTVK